MCQTFQTRHRSFDVSTDIPGRGDGPAFVKLGEAVDVAVSRRGSISWETMTFGMSVRGSEEWGMHDPREHRLLSNAREDRLDDVERWCQPIRQRLAVPIYGFRWKTGDEWARSSLGWAVGMYEEGYESRFVLVTDCASERPIPVIFDFATARDWLFAEQWKAIPLLRSAPRLGTAIADSAVQPQRAASA